MPTTDQKVPPIKIKNNQVVKTNSQSNKRPLSSNSSTPPSSPAATNLNKSKQFITPNRYAILTPTENESTALDNHSNDSIPASSNQDELNTSTHTPKNNMPPPVFIKGVTNFSGLLNDFKIIMGPENFTCKSTLNHLKVQPNTPDAYRKLITHLKNIQAQYHTCQIQSDKPYRIVIKNIHPSTPLEEISTVIEEIGYLVRNVTNIKQYQTKKDLPLFFVDLEPQSNNEKIFSVTSLLHTIVKIEEPHKKRQIPQYQNCQTYGHTRTYCAHTPKCVKCGEDHITSSWKKSPELPAKCALCGGAHPANYKGCTIYKNLTQKQLKPSNTSS